jgi:hypothetical protein
VERGRQEGSEAAAGVTTAHVGSYGVPLLLDVQVELPAAGSQRHSGAQELAPRRAEQEQRPRCKRPQRLSNAAHSTDNACAEGAQRPSVVAAARALCKKLDGAVVAATVTQQQTSPVGQRQPQKDTESGRQEHAVGDVTNKKEARTAWRGIACVDGSESLQHGL